MPRNDRPEAPRGAGGNTTLLVSSFASAPDPGAGPGNDGCFYDVVRRAFQPLFERYSDVIDVRRPESQLEFALLRARREGRKGMHLSFLPFTDVYLARGAENIVFAAWAFPDIPANDFKQNPRYHWVRIANHCSLVVPHSEFTAGNLRRAGVRAPIRVVPVPIDDGYFRTPGWDPRWNTTLNCTAYVFTRPEVPPLEANKHDVPPGADTLLYRLKSWIMYRRKSGLKAVARFIWIKAVKPWLPLRMAKALVAAKNAALGAWRERVTKAEAETGFRRPPRD
jgi:hypothetical protein